LGAGEILLNNVTNDGMTCGFDLVLIRSVCEAVSIPVIAVGGFMCPDEIVSIVA
jgi:cyclase